MPVKIMHNKIKQYSTILCDFLFQTLEELKHRKIIRKGVRGRFHLTLLFKYRKYFVAKRIFRSKLSVVYPSLLHICNAVVFYPLCDFNTPMIAILIENSRTTLLIEKKNPYSTF